MLLLKKKKKKKKKKRIFLLNELAMKWKKIIIGIFF